MRDEANGAQSADAERSGVIYVERSGEPVRVETMQWLRNEHAGRGKCAETLRDKARSSRREDKSTDREGCEHGAHNYRDVVYTSRKNIYLSTIRYLQTGATTGFPTLETTLWASGKRKVPWE